MTEETVLDMLRLALGVGFRISVPILGVSLVVGLIIGLFQALTSVQEMTLTFVPKLGAIIITFWLAMGFMGEMLVNFFQRDIIGYIAGH
ncbi:flagellar biosynthetic protein FliQ [Paracoccaceae bacterium GXU_MW_L88]